MSRQGATTMTATSMNVTCAGRAALRSLAYAGLLALIGAGSAAAENVLNDIRYTASPSGAVEVTLELAGPADDARVFTTDDPPRVAIDLPDTRNAVDRRRITVGSGATSAITALEANGRTRVIVDLFRPASFESRAEGNQLVLRVGDGSVGQVAAGGVPTVDPAKQRGQSVPVSSIDFRRGAGGSGRVIVRFENDNVSADLSDDNGGVVVEFDNASVPAQLSERLDVTDFATPVQFVDLRSGKGGSGARLSLTASGQYETLAYQTGNEYVVEITPIATEDGAAPSGVGVLEDDRQYTGTPVTFNFQNIPVRTVLQLIAEESGLNIVAADSVSGNVTLRLVNVPWDQAMHIVLRAKGLDQRRDGNVVWVAPQQEIAGYEQALAEAKLALEQRSPLVTEYIPINYGSAEEISKLLTEDAKRGSGGGAAGQGQSGSGFLSGRGSVSFDKRTNTLLLNDTEEKIREIKALIALLDRPVDQVLIEARIVIASETFARELGARFGISGGYRDSNGNIVTSSGSQLGADRMANLALANRFNGGGGLPVAAPGATGGGVLVPSLADRLNVNLPVISPSGTIGFAILGADYLLDLELSALEQEGRGEVVSSPRVITANQREAIIRQGDEVGYVTISPTQGTIPIPNVQFKEVLLQLAVTPTITQDGRVYMIMNVQKDEVSGFVDTSIGQVPQIATREVSTAVLVENSQTVVVGGVYEFSSREDLNKVPFLGDVPVLGNLFRKKGRSTEKAELLIFVTPRILAVSGSPR